MDKDKLIQGLSIGLEIAKARNESDPGVSKAKIALAAFFSRRFSTKDSYPSSLRSLMQCTREDFPSMNERSLHFFMSGSNRLAGYHYSRQSQKGTVLCVHGLHGQADDCFCIGIDAFLRRGYDVFAIDLSASGASEGQGISGLQQSAFDVTSAVAYAQSLSEVQGKPLFLFGHSWGGYGISAALHFVHGISAIAEVSGFDTPVKEMLAIPGDKAHIPLDREERALRIALQERAGEDYDLSASEGIALSKVPALLIHGDKDGTVPLERSSIYASAEEAPNVRRLLREGFGHMDIFLSRESASYLAEVERLSNRYFASVHMDVSKVSAEEKRAFCASFDKRLCSVADPWLFDEIDAFFLQNRP